VVIDAAEAKDSGGDSACSRSIDVLRLVGFRPRVRIAKESAEWSTGAAEKGEDARRRYCGGVDEVGCAAHSCVVRRETLRAALSEGRRWKDNHAGHTDEPTYVCE
jgi:hypothetical protein